MGYVDENLMPGESVVHRTSLHWIVFVQPTVIFLIGLAAMRPDLAWLGFTLILVAIIDGLSRLITFRTSEFAVTTKRVLVKEGWLRRRSLETLLTKVEGIGVHQGLLGRVFGYGTIVVTGTGGTKEPFSRIRSPLDFRRRVQEQIAG